jgi:hypothetical protein
MAEENDVVAERERIAALVERYVSETWGWGPRSVAAGLVRVIREGHNCPWPGIGIEEAKKLGWWVDESRLL